MVRISTLALLAALVVTLVVAAPSNAALPKLVGTVGPGFTITLKRFGKPFKTMKAGRYSITVTDRSSIHNFHLRGPGLNREITAIGFQGVKTVVVRLVKGKRYTFVCDPHLTTMKGSFRVT